MSLNRGDILDIFIIIINRESFYQQCIRVNTLVILKDHPIP